MILFRKLKQSIVYTVVVALFGLLFNNCGATHHIMGGGAVNSQLLACYKILEDEFQKGYAPFLQRNCAGCHSKGGTGNGAFADANATVAWDAFRLRAYDLIDERALDPTHQAGVTGPQHEAELAPIRTAYQAAVERELACEAQIGENSGGGGGPGLELEVPTEAKFFTTAKTMSAGNNPTTITWNLASEFETAGAPSLTGVSFSMDVQVETTPTGDQYYRFTQPELQTGASNVRIAMIQIRINGELENSATTYRGINQIVLANQNQNLTLTNMIVPRSPAVNDTLSVGFGVIEETAAAPNEPGAVRFASLVATGGVFANNCVSCHSGNNPMGGLNLMNFQQARGATVPGNANASLIIQRMTSNNNPMPPNGRLNNGQISIVQDWINDGSNQ
jgi:mono/diheme cytochrome c family protein